MASLPKTDFEKSFALLLEKPTGRGKPARLQKTGRAEAEAPAHAVDDAPGASAAEERLPQESLGEWDGFDDEREPDRGWLDPNRQETEDLPEEDFDRSPRPPSRVGRVSIQAKLPLHVHRRLDNLLIRANKMSRQKFLYRTLQAELLRNMPQRARRLRLPVWSGTDSQFVQAYIPAQMHRHVKVRAAEYGMTIQELLTRLILFRISRGRVPKPILNPSAQPPRENAA